MFRFNKRYFLAAVALFCLEVLIALTLHDRFVRPYVGDFLATILLYFLLRSFIAASRRALLLLALLASYLIETAQYFHLLARLGWQHSRLVSIVLGSSFEWGDMLAYTLGALLVLVIEQLRAAPEPHFQSS